MIDAIIRSFLKAHTLAADAERRTFNSLGLTIGVGTPTFGVFLLASWAQFKILFVTSFTPRAVSALELSSPARGVFQAGGGWQIDTPGNHPHAKHMGSRQGMKLELIFW